jgi:uncharacterized protein (TIGR02588 family)
MKEKIVFGVGLAAVLLVAVLIICGINAYNDDQAKAAVATTDMLLQQKDATIAKLVKQLRMKDAAIVTAKAQLGTAESKLNSSAAELEGAKKKIDTIKAEVNSPIEVTTASKK